MRKACFRLEPVSALIDAWILARQMDQLFSEGAGADAFGTLQPEAVVVARRLADQMREIGGSIAVSPEARAEFERKVIDPWLAEHPLRDLTFVRESPIARFAEQSRARGDTLQAVGTMEDLALSLSQQARLYLADLPRQVRENSTCCAPICCLLKTWRRCRATCASALPQRIASRQPPKAFRRSS